jgi:hypothetical protein
LSQSAQLIAPQGDVQTLRNGIDRIYAKVDNGWWGQPGEAVTYTFEVARQLSRARLVFDSDLTDKKRMPCWFPKKGNTVQMPKMLPQVFALEAQDATGNWSRIYLAQENYQRLVKIPLTVEAKAIRFVPICAWGGERVHLMAFDVK